MNGEIADLCRIVLAVRKAMITNTVPEYSGAKYVSKTVFIPSGSTAQKDLPAWYEEAVSGSLCDVKLLVPTRVEDRSILGFSNTHNGWMTCYYRDGIINRMVPGWRYNREQKSWEAEYREVPWEDAPKRIPVYHDHTAQFINVLLEIRRLADTICEPYFYACFSEALSVLNDKDSAGHNNSSGIEWPHAANFLAAHAADVFGAMGSWNDTPEGKAHAMKLSSEYNRLSDALLEQIRLNLMYAVNEGNPV